MPAAMTALVMTKMLIETLQRSLCERIDASRSIASACSSLPRVSISRPAITWTSSVVRLNVECRRTRLEAGWQRKKRTSRGEGEGQREVEESGGVANAKVNTSDTGTGKSEWERARAKEGHRCGTIARQR
eukprot:6183898-Pleurochrysis_carterae.AAC.3